MGTSSSAKDGPLGLRNRCFPCLGQLRVEQNASGTQRMYRTPENALKTEYHPLFSASRRHGRAAGPWRRAAAAARGGRDRAIARPPAADQQYGRRHAEGEHFPISRCFCAKFGEI